MANLSKIIAVILLGLVLVLIRGFENVLFYDPYLAFFKNDYLYLDNPRREVAKLVFNTSFRFFLNSITSLGIVYVLFKDTSLLKFAALIYGISYLFLIVPFLYFVIHPKQEDYYLFFNIRRFLIQPILLIILLPAFYYHKLKR